MRTTGESPLNQLQTALSGLADIDVTLLSDGEVRDRLPVLLSALNTLGAVLATTVASFDTRELAEADGCRSARAWLTAFGRMSPHSAAAWLERGRLLRQFPALGAAASRGAVSVEHLRKVGDLVERHTAAELAPFDAILATLAAETTPAHVQRACERISAQLDPDGPDPAKDFERRGLTMSRSGSMIGLRGQLDPEAGAAVLTALDALMRPPGRDDTRTARQRRADALAELARHSLDRGDLPTVGGVRPTLGILLEPASLLTPAPRTFVDPTADPGEPVGTHRHGHRFVCASGTGQSPTRPPDDEPPPASCGPPTHARPPAGGDPLTAAGVAASPQPAFLGWAGPIPDALAQRIACDCDVWRAVLDPGTGLPLEVGRTHRLVPHWIRRALQARDRGCRWPGCGAPVEWTDAHHLRAWYHGGETNVDNLLCLCRFHHSKVHEGRWRIRLDRATGQVHVTRPDGRPYELGPSRPWAPTPYPRDPAWPDAA